MNFLLDIAIWVVVICASVVIGVALGKFIRYSIHVFGGALQELKQIREEEEGKEDD